MRKCLALIGLVALTISGFAQERIRDVIYMKSGGAAFTFDVFKPKSPNGGALMWLVSGGWFSTHEGISPALAKTFNDEGFTVVEVVHGSQPRYHIDEIVKQIRRAVRFVHANAATYGIDPNRIAISGGSAGGHLSLMIATTGDNGDPDAKDPVDRASSKVKTVVAFFPPTDFLNWGKPDYIPLKDPAMAIFVPAFGINAMTATADRIKEVATADSPITYLTAAMPPTLLIHGDKDPLVPLQQSQEFDAKLAALGVEHKLVVIPGGVHGENTFVGGLPQVIAWLHKYLAK